MIEGHELRSVQRDPEDLGRRLADLLERRRAGLLADERLHLAAYLGDPAARVLWSETLPDEEELRAGPLARFFDGVEEETERSWERERAQARGPIQRALDLAAKEPRLRRLFASGAALGLTLSWCSRDRSALHYETGFFQFRGDRWGIHQGRHSRAEAPVFSEIEPMLEALVSSLPEEPRPVWLGRREDLPLERARRGLLNDALGPEGVLAGLFAWPRPITARAIVALEPRLRAIWAAATRPAVELRGCFDATRSWLREPSQETERALNIAVAALSQVALDLDSLRRMPAVAIVARLVCQAPTRLDHIRGLDPLRALISAGDILAGSARELIPWALYDEEPLAR